MKKILAALLAASLCLGAFAGCSGDSGTSSTPSGNTGDGDGTKDYSQQEAYTVKLKHAI